MCAHIHTHTRVFASMTNLQIETKEQGAIVKTSEMALHRKEIVVQ